MEKLLLSLFLSFCVVASTQAAVTYTFDETPDRGKYTYYDPDYSKLTDGNRGFAGWEVRNAEAWVGWFQTPRINIDFDLGGIFDVRSISVTSTQDTLQNVVLPSLEVYELVGSDWVLKGALASPPSESNNVWSFSKDAPKELVLSDLDIYSRYVRLSVLSQGSFAFLSEVSFAVPEPATAPLVLAGLGLLAWKRRRQA